MEGFEWLKDNWVKEDNLKKVNKLSELADKLGISLPQLSIAWCLKNPNVSTAILGATKLTQLKENIKSLDAVSLLTEGVLQKIEKIMANKPAMPQF